MPALNETPTGERVHIAIYGKRNAGKSSLINAITNQDIALVSDIAGTTTDPVKKSMEIRGIGACMIVDTAGFDDNGKIGNLRIEKTEETVQKTDIAILLCSAGSLEYEKQWSEKLKKQNVKQIAVVSKADEINADILAERVQKELGLKPVVVSAKTRLGIDELLAELARAVPPDFGNKSILGGLADKNDVVMLVMPQDSEAPKGRLILPQVQTIRELLNKECISINTIPENMQKALENLKNPPKLIITDSQVFKEVYEKKPKESLLTSFSILFAAYKGDLNEFISGANALDSLNSSSHILIAEACTHAPLSEDIGRVKIPNLLRKKFGKEINIDIVSGVDFPINLKKYDLIIHCGGCMFSRVYLMNRIAMAKRENIPITNYGIFIAKMNGLLENITLPKQN